MKREFFIFPLLLLLSACSKNNIESKIVKEAQNNCVNTSCKITISQVTNFKWDKMFVFNSPSSLETINSAIGLNYPYYVEFSREIIFMDKGKIVHYENNPANEESLTNGQVVFDYPDSLKYKAYDVSKSTFTIKQKTLNNITYYELSQ